MAWRYTFDGGPEKPLDASSIYQIAAMKAFTQEDITLLPILGGAGIKPYDGHVLKLWDDDLVDSYPPSLYGLGWAEYGCLQIAMLGKCKDH